MLNRNGKYEIPPEQKEANIKDVLLGIVQQYGVMDFQGKWLLKIPHNLPNASNWEFEMEEIEKDGEYSYNVLVQENE